MQQERSVGDECWWVCNSVYTTIEKYIITKIEKWSWWILYHVGKTIDLECEDVLEDIFRTKEECKQRLMEYVQKL